MNYKLHYDMLIQKYSSDKEGYHELHHIVPKCVGGDDSEENLVRLSPEAHYTAHLLLVKIYDNYSLVCAAKMMSMNPHGNRSTNKLYGWLRRKFNNRLKEYWSDSEFREKIKKKTKEWWTFERKQIVSERMKKYYSVEHNRKKNSERVESDWKDINRREDKINGMRNSWKNDEFRAKQSESTKNFFKKEENRKNISEKQKLLWKDPERVNRKRIEQQAFARLKEKFIVDSQYIGDKRSITKSMIEEFYEKF